MCSSDLPTYLEKTIIAVLFLLLPVAVVSGFALTPLNIILILPFIVYFAKSKRLPTIKQPVIISIIALLFWTLLSVSWSIDPAMSIKYWIKIFLIIATGIILVTSCSNITGKELLKYFPLALIIGLVFFIIEVNSEASVTLAIRAVITPDRENIFRVDGFNKPVCFLTLFIWPVVAATLLNHNKHKQKRKFLVTLLWALSAYIIFNLQSLSAIAGFVGGTITFLFVILTKKKFNFLITLAIFVVAIITPIVAKSINPQEIIERFDNISGSAVHRIFIWDFSAEKASEKPLLGWGIKTSRIIPGGQDRVSIDGAFYKRELIPSHPHNIILQILLEIGGVGYLIFLSLIYLSFRQINKVSSVICNASYNALLISYLVVGMLAFDMWRIWWLSAVIIALFFMQIVVNTYSASNSLDKVQN